jgi:hypothetical protein
MAIWATPFMLLREFSDFTTARYHSRVYFAAPGYGDIAMSRHWRTLDPIEAANGMVMFGVLTSA